MYIQNTKYKIQKKTRQATPAVRYNLKKKKNVHTNAYTSRFRPRFAGNVELMEIDWGIRKLCFGQV